MFGADVFSPADTNRSEAMPMSKVTLLNLVSDPWRRQRCLVRGHDLLTTE